MHVEGTNRSKLMNLTGAVNPLYSLHMQSIYQEVLLTALSLLSNFLFELFID